MKPLLSGLCALVLLLGSDLAAPGAAALPAISASSALESSGSASPPAESPPWAGTEVEPPGSGADVAADADTGTDTGADAGADADADAGTNAGVQPEGVGTQRELALDPALEIAPETAPGTAPETAQPGLQAAQRPTLAQVRADVVRITNELRAAQGRGALKSDPRLDAIALTWSEVQARDKTMKHNPAMSSQVPAGWARVGENVAYGYSSAAAVMEGWRTSSGHYANIIQTQYTHIGVGVAYSTGGVPYYTQVFAAYPGGLAAPGVFVDVNPGAPFYKEITWMFESGLSNGSAVPSGRAYLPKSSVSREAMAAFLYRLNTPAGATKPAGYTVPSVSPFADVPTNHKFYKEIAWMGASGISTGNAQPRGKPTYDPRGAVSREAMAAFIARMEGTNGYKAPRTSSFQDVAPNDKFYTQISWMYDSGLSTGTKQPGALPKYEPRQSVSREAMAAFIYRLRH
ncbi:CAP domain-containing protein [Leucobacter sp. HY1908]